MTGLTPIPDPEEPRSGGTPRIAGDKKRRAESPQKARAPIASAEECLQVLSRLAGLVALGILSTAQANSIRATYVAILQHHARQQTGPSRTVNSATEMSKLAKLLREHPELAEMLEPLLSDVQIATLVRGGKDADDAAETA